MGIVIALIGSQERIVVPRNGGLLGRSEEPSKASIERVVRSLTNAGGGTGVCIADMSPRGYSRAPQYEALYRPAARDGFVLARALFNYDAWAIPADRRIRVRRLVVVADERTPVLTASAMLKPAHHPRDDKSQC
jgi:hypothetical protein